MFFRQCRCWWSIAALCLVLVTAVDAQAQQTAASPSMPVGPRYLAPGFSQRAAASRVVVVPADMELFSISAGGVAEPKADWTADAQRNFRAALQARMAVLGDRVTELSEADLDEFAEVNTLHGAVAEAVFLHHMLGHLALPTKNGTLDWSLGDAVRPLKDRTGADYALFTWIRDSYASSERKAAMVALALLGVGVAGGTQVGYASLVDLTTGRIVWFGNLLRGSGDLREASAAQETVDVLLRGFPPSR